MQIWIITKGEAHNGADILAVYPNSEAARPRFEREAAALAAANERRRRTRGYEDQAFRAYRSEDGAFHATDGYDTVTLAPWEVEKADTTAPAADVPPAVAQLFE